MQAISFGYTHIFVPEALAEYVDYTWRDSSEFGILDWKIFVSLLPNIEQRNRILKRKIVCQAYRVVDGGKYCF